MEKMVCVALVVLSLALQAYSGPVSTQDFHFHESETEEVPCFAEHPENATTSMETPEPEQMAAIAAIPGGDTPKIQLDYDASKAPPAMFEMYDGQTRLLCVIAPPVNEVEDAINDIESLDDLSAVRKAEALRQEQPVNVGNSVVAADESEDGRSDLDPEPEPESEPESEPEPESCSEPEPCAEPEPDAETETTSPNEPEPESSTGTELDSALETTTEPDSGPECQPTPQESDSGSLSGSEKEALLLPLTSSSEPAPNMLSPESDYRVAEGSRDVAHHIAANKNEGSANISSITPSNIDEERDIEPEATDFLTQTTELAANTTDLPSEIKEPLSENASEVVPDADTGATTVPAADDLKASDNREGDPESIGSQDNSENISTDQTLRQPESPQDPTVGAGIRSDTKDPIESGSEAVETTKMASIFKKKCNRSSGLRRMPVMA